MSARTFHMRLQCRYSGSNNSIASLVVEHSSAGQWQPLDPGLNSPGFEIFVYALFSCQHMYFRANCAERGLRLASAEGSIEVGAADDWKMESLVVKFRGHLAGGTPAGDDIDYIVERMHHCPVSSNIHVVRGASTTVELA
jgi:organic hydroperoxide reductase OsmC/OhrA